MSDELIVRQCSPTLAGMKTGSIFMTRFENKSELNDKIRSINRRLKSKGIRIVPLRYDESSALIYIYRPLQLERDFVAPDATRLLLSMGYKASSPSECVTHLIDKLDKYSDFPHEIGLFLGYPLEDVVGFIENNAKHSKLTGYWKVYGDTEAAKKKFNKYRKCTNVYSQQLEKGKSLEQLTVAV